MKRNQHKLSKMQRQVRSQRKTWTNAERFRLKHLREMEAQMKQMKALQKMLKEMQAQVAAKEAAEKTEPEHTHTESCQHDLPEEVVESHNTGSL